MANKTYDLLLIKSNMINTVFKTMQGCRDLVGMSLSLAASARKKNDIACNERPQSESSAETARDSRTGETYRRERPGGD